MEVAIGMLLIGVAVGVAIGWSIGLLIRTPEAHIEYTRVQVYKNGYALTTLDGFTYYFGYFGPEITFAFATGQYQAFPATQGQTYFFGIEVVVSEVKDEYLILLVKSR
jgi:hypothetical protein